MTQTATRWIKGALIARPSADQPPAQLWRFRGHQLNPRRNSFNLIRLALAIAVLYHHSWPLGGFAGRPEFAGIQVGGWAVDGFFCISGYLIFASRRSNRLGTYLVHRIARIYPGFWVCLVVTIGIFAPIAYLHENGALDGYLTTGGVTPLNYLLLNATLQINSYGVGQTLAANPYPSAWDGSLWTLYYEFACYLIVGALAVAAWFRRGPLPMVAAFGFSVLLQANISIVMPYLGSNADARNLIGLLPFFLGGASVQLLRERLPLHWAGALIGVLGTGILLHVSIDWGAQLAAPFMIYLLLWVASTLPSPALIRRHDISYGVYIYAFPAQQLLASFGMNKHGVLTYAILSLLLTVPLAIGSWLLVERPMMRRARGADANQSSLTERNVARVLGKAASSR